ncbi:Gfo/Idh/MocA family protein [Actomonas aquatica]|uniref:Gfo/Idh/MocA family oxidoreductase n=1 Tax=Actomonas aquatica TaxID=2866162 RepID=A0ABZ1C3R6_9BACT|nr:Gfo/Idh/MocA family oxidoreductase [Opitutus sp. WL0086]WRQ85883.1 Gfo/Idh/MocA family oxidoreductase [Opitutus sp. WL0086]
MSSAPLTPSFSRRRFLGSAALAAAPLILPARLFGATAPSNRLRIGQIGAGRIARGHDMVNVIGSNLADIVAVCDVDRQRALAGQTLVDEIRTEQRIAGPAPEVSVHDHHDEILARTDIDAVVISTPEHWHAELVLAALYAGKDVYVQKPITLTHAEGILVREAERVTGRILQVGSQQRSWKQFREGVALVRAGRIGKIRAVEIGLPIDPTDFDEPPMPIPAGLDYDRWLGPAPMAYYTEQRVHPQDGYDRPGWLRNEAFTLGMITGWGSHHFDIAHWGMDLDLSGPTGLHGWATFPTNRIWNVHNAYEVQLTYPGDIQMTVSDQLPNGVRWIGDEGWIWVSRWRQEATTGAGTEEEPRRLNVLDASDKALLDLSTLPEPVPSIASHHINWLESVKSREAPLATAAIGHRSNAACILSWIAMKLARPLRWDATAERFIDDDEANAMLSRPERAGYGANHFMAHRNEARA